MPRSAAQIEHEIERTLQERARILRACGGHPSDDQRARLRTLDLSSARLHSELRDVRNRVTVNRASPRPVESDGGALERYRRRTMKPSSHRRVAK